MSERPLVLPCRREEPAMPRKRSVGKMVMDMQQASTRDAGPLSHPQTQKEPASREASGLFGSWAGPTRLCPYPRINARRSTRAAPRGVLRLREASARYAVTGLRRSGERPGLLLQASLSANGPACWRSKALAAMARLLRPQLH